jgi:FkbM family methyltransferase
MASHYNTLRKFVATNRDNRFISYAAYASQIFLDLVDNARHWNFETNGEQFVCRFLLSITSGVVFDVGAYQGDFAKFLAEFDNKRVIFAFEPVPEQSIKAEHNLSSFKNVRVVHKGLSDKVGTETIFLNEKHPDTAGTVHFLYDFDALSEFKEIPCSFTSGDSFCDEQSVTHISLLKIDVEGMEKRVLQGFSRMLAERRIDAIQFEHGPTHAETGDTVRSLQRWLNELGYIVWAIFPNGVRTIPNTGISAETFRGRNFLAALEELQPKIKEIVVGAC